jgi:hypothetical protein
MATFNKFNLFVQALVRKQHNFNSDLIRFALTNTTPVATNSVLADITQIAGSGGYTAGGAPSPTGLASSSANASGPPAVETVSVAASPAISWTATGGGMTFQWVVAYNDTATNDNLVGFWNYGSALTLSGANGDTFTVTGPATSLFTLS